MAVRRVVTGQTADGPAVVSDEQLEPVTPALLAGAGFLQLWGEDRHRQLELFGERVLPEVR